MRALQPKPEGYVERERAPRKSSFTTDAGRWMTSPAAIWLATESGRSFITSLISDGKITRTADHAATAVTVTDLRSPTETS